MQHLILVGLLVAALLPVLVLVFVDKNKASLLSEHIAERSVTVWITRLIISVAAVLILTWYFGWYGLHWGNNIQTFLITTVAITATLIGAFPLYPGSKYAVAHNVFAWAYAALLPLTIISFYFTESLMYVRAITGALVIWQITVLLLFIFYKPARAYSLYYQISYIATFAVELLVVSYAGK